MLFPGVSYRLDISQATNASGQCYMESSIHPPGHGPNVVIVSMFWSMWGAIICVLRSISI